MPQRAGNITIRAKWKSDDSNICHANVFQFFFTPYLCTLYVGFINPADMIPPPAQQDKAKDAKTVDVHFLGKYSLDFESFLRLKDEIDKTHKILEETGAFKDGK
jgi:hypothetical protein